MAINKVIYGTDTLVDLTEDTVTAEDVLNSKSFHTPDGVKRTGTASYPVTDVQVNGTSVMDGTVAKVEQPTAEVKSATDTFTTVNGGLLSKCVIDLEPVQDLHGYDSPWVGGAGKNKCIFWKSGYIDASGNRISDSKNGMSQEVYVPSGASVTFSAGMTGAGRGLAVYSGSGLSDLLYRLTSWTHSSTNLYEIRYTATQNCYIVAWYNYDNSTVTSENIFETAKLQIEFATQATAYEPYSNICPISGHTEVDLYNVGKNRTELLRTGVYSSTDGSYVGGNVYAHAIAEVEPNTTYTISVENTGSIGAVLFYKDVNGLLTTPITTFISSHATGSAKNITITTPSTAKCLVYETGGTSTPITKDTIGNVQIEFGSTATSFEPYKGHLYTVQIGQTVYGGTVDFVTGEMTVDRVYFKTTVVAGVGSQNNKYYWVIRNNLVSKNGPNAISSHFKSENNFDIGNCYVSSSGHHLLAVPIDQTLNTKALADAWCAENEPEFCYLTTDVQVIQLTSQQLIALVGENNLSAPLTSQEVISTTYEQIASFNAVLDDANQSSESTYSSEKIEESYVGKDDVETKSATDSFVTTNGGLLSKCMIDLVPVQSGSGDPYPAGGGKNKLEVTATTQTINGVTFTVNSDGSVRANGTASGNAILVLNSFIFDGTSVILNGCPTGGSGSTYRLDAFGSSGLSEDIGNGVTISTSGERNIRIVVFSGTTIDKIFKPMLRLSTETDPTFAPYSNVRPIIGHTEVDLYNVEKNKLPLVLADIKSGNTSGTWSGNTYTYNNLVFSIITDSDNNISSINVNGIANNDTFFNLVFGLSGFADGETVILNGTSGGSDTTYYLQAYKYDGTSQIKDYGSGTSAFTINNATPDSRIRISIKNGVTLSNQKFYPMLRLSTDTDSTFEPYLGHLYQVQIGSIVYGGYVDLVSGEMVVTLAYKDLGELSYTKYNVSQGTLFRASLSGIKQVSGSTVVPNDWCSQYKTVSNSARTDKTLSQNPNTSAIDIIDDDYSDTNTFKTAMSGVQLVYELATPQTIQLTPQQIETLAGQNNLSTPLDGQSIDSVEYREVFAFDDVEKVVSLRVPISTLGTDESGRTTASHSYASGDYFYKDGYMCKALTSISAGATLTLNTNYSQGTLADILKAIENS